MCIRDSPTSVGRPRHVPLLTSRMPWTSEATSDFSEEPVAKLCEHYGYLTLWTSYVAQSWTRVGLTRGSGWVGSGQVTKFAKKNVSNVSLRPHNLQQ